MTKLCKGHEGKQSHPSRTAAVAHAISARKDRGHDVNAYRCPGCKRWFIGGTRLSKQERVWKLIDEANGTSKDA